MMLKATLGSLPLQEVEDEKRNKILLTIQKSINKEFADSEEPTVLNILFSLLLLGLINLNLLAILKSRVHCPPTASTLCIYRSNLITGPALAFVPEPLKLSRFILNVGFLFKEEAANNLGS